jgi:hypothetical protein
MKAQSTNLVITAARNQGSIRMHLDLGEALDLDNDPLLSERSHLTGFAKGLSSIGEEREMKLLTWIEPESRVTEEHCRLALRLVLNPQDTREELLDCDRSTISRERSPPQETNLIAGLEVQDRVLNLNEGEGRFATSRGTDEPGSTA